MLSGIEILKYLPEVNILRYIDLEELNDIEEGFGKQGLVILYPTVSDNEGHWCCLFINPRDDKLYFFDSYGIIPDDQLEFRTEEYTRIVPKTYRHLTKLLLNSKREVDYNPWKFQSDSPKITTCGLWCVARILFSHRTCDEFHFLFGPGYEINQDKLVTKFIEGL